MFNRTSEIERMSEAIYSLVDKEQRFELFGEVAIDIATKLIDTVISVGLDAPIKGIGDLLDMSALSDSIYYGSKSFGVSEDISTYKRGKVTVTENLKRLPVAFFFLVIDPKSGKIQFLPFSNVNGEMKLPKQITVSGKNHPAMIDVYNIESEDALDITPTERTPFMDMLLTSSTLIGDTSSRSVLFKVIEVTKTRKIEHKRWFRNKVVFKELDHYFFIQPITINKPASVKVNVPIPQTPYVYIIDPRNNNVITTDPTNEVPPDVRKKVSEYLQQMHMSAPSSVYDFDDRTGLVRNKPKPIEIKPSALAVKRDTVEKWFARMRETHLEDLNEDIYREVMNEVRNILSNDVTATNVSNIRFKSGTINSFEPLEYRDSYKEPYKVLTAFYKIMHSDGYTLDYVPQTVDVPDDQDTLVKLMRDQNYCQKPVMYTALRIHTLSVEEAKYFNEITLEWIFIADDVEDDIFIEKPLLEA